LEHKQLFGLSGEAENHGAILAVLAPRPGFGDVAQPFLAARPFLAISRQRRYAKPMTERATELMQKALSLSEEERADLACSLIDSLDATVDEGAQNTWEHEIARRVADLDSGRAKTVSWEEVRERISSKLPNGRKLNFTGYWKERR
jgi:putative addiction module component (TIGR02574 family)